MGLFDFLIKKENEQNASKVNVGYESKEEAELPFKMVIKENPNGKIQYDFYDKKPNFKHFYDTTRLIVNKKPINIEGKDVYDCLVSWYSQDDDVRYNKDNEEFSRRAIYRNILAELDLNLLQNDELYYTTIMRELLESGRVTDYLLKGMVENPKSPCGKYIGGIKKEKNRYDIYFDPIIGKASHYSEEMVNKRRQKDKVNKKKTKNKELSIKNDEECR